MKQTVGVTVIVNTKVIENEEQPEDIRVEGVEILKYIRDR